MAFADAIAAAVEILREGMPGMGAQTIIPDFPPEQLNALSVNTVYAFCWPGTGRVDPQAHSGRQGRPLVNSRHTIRLEVGAKRGDLPTTLATLYAFPSALPLLLFAAATRDAWGGTILGLEQIRYQHGNLGWGGVLTMGFTFDIDIWLIEEVPAPVVLMTARTVPPSDSDSAVEPDREEMEA